MKLVHVGAAVLNQTPLDWDGNKARIERACELAPEVAAYHLTRGRVLRGQGLREKARKARS